MPGLFLLGVPGKARSEEHMIKHPAWSLGIGIALGAALGVGFGLAMHDIGVGLAVGAGLGAALGGYKMSQKKSPR